MKNQQQATMDLEESKMNKKIIVASLSEIANELDDKGMFKEADTICTQNEEPEKYLMTFQNFLARVPKWNDEIVSTEVTRIIEKSK